LRNRTKIIKHNDMTVVYRVAPDLKTVFYRLLLDEFNKENHSCLSSRVIGKIKKYLNSKNVGCAINKCNNISVVW
jgi:hypothetical protein